MYSLNVPVPGEVKRLAARLRPELSAFDRVRERHTLVCKRFDTDEYADPSLQYDRLRERLGTPIARTEPFELHASEFGVFEEPVRGPGPVLYLAIEGSKLRALHERLTREFGAIEALEGEDYTPHVTLARGGSLETARALADREIEPIEWTVSKLHLWDGSHREVAGRLPLSRD